MTIQLLTDYKYGKHTIPAGSVVNVFGSATEAGLIAAKQAISSAAAVTWTVPTETPVYDQLTPAEVSSTRALVSADGKAAAPLGVRAFAQDSAIRVTWDKQPPAYADSYTVSVSPGGASATVVGTAAIVSGLTNGVSYTVSVTAVKGATVSRTVSAGTVTPTAGPAGLSAVPGLIAWLAADKIAGPPANGASVSSWPDSSGNGFGAASSVALRPTGTQTFGTSPTFVASWSGGRPALNFSGGCMGFPFDFTTAGPIGAEATIFVACECSASLNAASSAQQEVLSNYSYVASPTADDQRGFILDTKGPGSPVNNWRAVGGHGPAALGPWAAATPTILSVTCPPAGQTGALYVSGAIVAGSPVMSLARTKVRWGLGGSPAGGGASLFGGRIAEVLIYNRALTQPERWAVEAYLSAKYGITVTQS